MQEREKCVQLNTLFSDEIMRCQFTEDAYCTSPLENGAAKQLLLFLP